MTRRPPSRGRVERRKAEKQDRTVGLSVMRIPDAIRRLGAATCEDPGCTRCEDCGEPRETDA